MTATNLVSDQPFALDLPSLTSRWCGLRSRLDGMSSAIPLLAEGLPLRAARLLEDESITTVQQLLGFDPEELVDRNNLGRATIAALLARAEALVTRTTMDPASPDFVEIVDLVVGALPDRAARVIVSRFENHIRVIDVVRTEGVSRERVRQIEEKFVQRLKIAIMRHRLPLDNVLDDRLIQYDELTAGTRQVRFAPHFYVSVARAVLGGGDSYVDVERYYSTQLRLLADEIGSDDDYILGRFPIDRALQIARELTPALRELPNRALTERIRAVLRAQETGGRITGRKPRVGRIIRALLRRAGGPVSINLLTNELASVLATYSEVSYFDAVRLRNKLFSMEDVQLLDEQTAALETPHPDAATKWVNLAVSAIRKAGKPYSLSRFLDQYDDAPFDVFGLASLLRSDDRVVHLGRRLYGSAEYEAEGPLRIAELIEEALRKTRTPMTRAELLAYVRVRRDLKSRQMEHYYVRVPGIVIHTQDIVGLAPLDRSVMLRMLERETCVLSLLAAAGEQGPVHISTLWLPPDEDSALSADEEKMVVAAATEWSTAYVDCRSSGLFFGIRED